jgi:hypothetical protein
MAWTAGRWPPKQGDAIDTDLILNEVRAALEERDGLVPALFVPDALERWQALRGTPAGRNGGPRPTVANFQYEVQQMLGLVWPLRWWDPAGDDLYTLENLCQAAFGRGGWSYDLTALTGQGEPADRWTPPYALLFEELYLAINLLDRVRVLPTWSESSRRDSVYRLTFGIGDWAAERAATFALFDGVDDGASAQLAFDVGMGGRVIDDGASQQWMLEAREFRMSFATGPFDGCAVRRGRLDFTTAAPEGQADYADTFTVQVVDGDGLPLGTFASQDLGPKQIEVPASSISTDGETVLEIRSARADAADRPAWSPPGPDYSSTYREGLAVAGPIRLIVEVDFEYHG